MEKPIRLGKVSEETMGQKIGLDFDPESPLADDYDNMSFD